MQLMTNYRWKYVDDLTLMEVVHRSQQATMQMHMDALSVWSQLNDMRPKPEKCKIMQINFVKHPPLQPQINIDDSPLQRAD